MPCIKIYCVMTFSCFFIYFFFGGGGGGSGKEMLGGESDMHS